MARTPAILLVAAFWAVSAPLLVAQSNRRTVPVQESDCTADADGDGVPACLDCDDHDPTVAPGFSELCDLKDNDCDGLVDDLTATGCKLGIGACEATGLRTCSPSGEVSCSAAMGSPSGEVCDGIDNDCDGEIDEDLVMPCASDCEAGLSKCFLGRWSQCTARPCCECTVGTGQTPPTLCEVVQAGCKTVCLAPGTYAVGDACTFPSGVTLEALAPEYPTTVVGDMFLDTGAAVIGLTVDGNVGMYDGAVLNSTVFGEVSADGSRYPFLIAFNDIHGRVFADTSGLVWGNRVTGAGITSGGSAGVAIIDNEVSDADVGIAAGVRPLAVEGNLIRHVGIGLQSSSWRVSAARNTITDCNVGIDLHLSTVALKASVLRNTISDARDAGLRATGPYDILTIMGNVISRSVADPGHPLAMGIDLTGGGRISGNTIAGVPRGLFIEDATTGAGLPPSLDLDSNIVAFSSVSGIENRATGTFVSSRRNDVYGSGAGWVGHLPPPGLNGNLSVDPLFQDVIGGSLKPGSPCVDHGDVLGYALDVSGQPRQLDGDMDGVEVEDIGAFETSPEVVDLVAQLAALQWSANPYAVNGFDVYRGHAGAAGVSTMNPLVCGLQTTAFIDPVIPAPGDGFVYLVAPRGLVRGSLGLNSAGEPRVLAVECP